MTKFQDFRFSVHYMGKKYSDNYDRVFGCKQQCEKCEKETKFKPDQDDVWRCQECDYTDG